MGAWERGNEITIGRWSVLVPSKLPSKLPSLTGRGRGRVFSYNSVNIDLILMSYGPVLTFKCAMGDVTLHFVENVLVERLQSLREIARRLGVEGVNTIR